MEKAIPKHPSAVAPTLGTRAHAADTGKKPAEPPSRQFEQERKEWEAKVQSLTDSLQRMAADFDNYRKRIAKEASQARAEATRGLIQDLLPVLDHFEIAIAAFPAGHDPLHPPTPFPPNNNPSDTPERASHGSDATTPTNPPAGATARTGFELLYAQLFSTLERHGLTPLDALGKPFDPHIHEALLSEHSQEKNKIIEVLQKGYILNGQLIRTAKVKITT